MALKRILILANFVLVFSGQLFPQTYGHRYSDAHYVGIPTDDFSPFMTAQDNTYWCWAASAQIVLNYYDIAISQKEIVQRILGYDSEGELPNQGVTLETIHHCLNYIGEDTLGQQYKVHASMGKGAPIPAKLIEQLSQQKPVIVGYGTPDGGHVVVVTAVKYVLTESGPKILGFVVRDPMPDQTYSMNNGKIEYPGKYFARRINAYWFVDVEKL